MKTMPTLRSVQIRTSAIGDMLRAEIPSEVYIQLKEIFADSFNMSDLKEGDTVRLLYNSMYFRGQQMAVGDILAAEVVKDGKTYQAYYYSQGKGDEESGSYYDQTVSPYNKKKALIPSLLHTRAFLLRSATVSIRSCIPSVCTPVSTMPRRPVRRLRRCRRRSDFQRLERRLRQYRDDSTCQRCGNPVRPHERVQPCRRQSPVPAK